MSKKKPGAAASTSTPFFARYLEGQHDAEAADSAKVRGRSGVGYAKAKAKAAPIPIQTLKFPSDSDELHYFPYYPSKEYVPLPPGKKPKIITLKFPSDSDEGGGYIAQYITKAAVPKKASATTGLKEGKVQLQKAK
jgi:Serine endopeptidase inhibitors